MKLDKRHMAMAFTLLAGSIVYNVWVYTGPRRRPAETTSSPLSVGGTTTVVPLVDQAATPRIDQAGASPAADVAFDRTPVWPRNPFKAATAPAREAEVTARLVSHPEPEILLNSILYSPMRKLAMVNGRTVRIGDRVGDATVLDIRPNEIVVGSTRGVRTIARRRSPETAGTP